MKFYNTLSTKTLLTALDLEKNEEALIKFSLLLANKCKMKPAYFYAQKPTLLTKVLKKWGDNADLQQTLASIDAQNCLVLEQKLRSEVLKYSTQEWPATVANGEPASLINVTAKNMDARMILMGIDAHVRTQINLRFSILSQVVAASELPVFVIPSNYDGKKFAANPIKLLLADDLGSDNTQTIAFAFRLAASIENVEILHLNINELTFSGLESSLMTTLDSAYMVGSQNINVHELFNLMQTNIANTMQERAHPYITWAEAANVKYNAEVASGEAGEQLQMKIANYKPDIVIFGKHRAIHTGPFHLGKIPLAAMLESKTPCVIV